jgi:hypothetical protein
MINKKKETLYMYEVLSLALSAEIKGPVISPVTAALIDSDDIVLNPMALPSPIPPPDQAGKIPVHVYFCAEYDDMRPEREFLYSHVFPIIDRWLGAFRCQFVPVDMRYGVTRSECFHPEVMTLSPKPWTLKHQVVRAHTDEIDDCFPQPLNPRP